MIRRTLLVFLFAVLGVQALIHNLKIKDDGRTSFYIQSFGYETGGYMKLVLKGFEVRYVLPSSIS